MRIISIDNRTIVRVLIWIALFVAAWQLLGIVRTQLSWIAAAFFLAVALNPAVSFLARYLPRRSRGAGIMVVLLAFFLVLGFLVYSFLPPLVDQTQDLVNSVPATVDRLQNLGGPFGDLARHYNVADKISNASGDIFKYLSSATGSAVDIVRSLFSGFAALLTIFALTFFMLLEAPFWMRMFWALTPAHSRKRNQEIVSQMYKAVTGYVNGNFFTSLIAAMSSVLVMLAVHVPFAVPLALLVGLLDLVPLVGATVAAVIVVIVALFQSITAAIVLAIFFVLYQQVENNILQPLVYGKSTELSPLVVTISIIIGATLAGIFGALVAIPVAACIKVILVHAYGDRIAAAVKA